MSNVHKRMKSWRGGGGGAPGANRVQNSGKVFGQSRISDEKSGLAVSCGIYTQIHQIPNIREERREGEVQRIKVRK
jgi:hypothetical protein